MSVESAVEPVMVALRLFLLCGKIVQASTTGESTTISRP